MVHVVSGARVRVHCRAERRYSDAGLHGSRYARVMYRGPSVAVLAAEIHIQRALCL